jgi:WD40 repeat protein
MMGRSYLATLLLVPGLVGAGPPASARKDRLGDPLPPGAVARFGSARMRGCRTFVAVAFSPDGARVATADGRRVVLWDAGTGRQLHRLTEADEPEVRCLAFSADSRTLATGERGRVRLWDVATGRLRTTWEIHDRGIPITALAFAPDGGELALTLDESSIELRDVPSGKPIAIPDRERIYGRHPLFSPVGAVLPAGGPDDEGERDHLFDLRTRRPLRIRGQGHELRGIAFSPDGRYLAGANGNSLRLWELATGGVALLMRQPEGPYDHAVAFSPDGRRLAVGTSETAEVWDLPTGRRLHRFPTPEGRVMAVHFTPDGRSLFAATSLVHRWDLRTGLRELPRANSAGHVLGLALSADGKTLATGYEDHQLWLWDVPTGKALGRLDLPQTPPYVRQREHVPLFFVPGGDCLAVEQRWLGDPDGLLLWNLAAGRPRARAPTRHRAHRALSSPDGKRWALLDTLRPTLVEVWGPKGGKKPLRLGIRAPGGRPFSFRALAFTPDGRALASSGAIVTGKGDGEKHDQCTIHLWDVTTGEVTARLGPLPAWPRSLTFSRDGNTLTAMCRPDEPITVWEVDSGRRICTLEWKEKRDRVAHAPNTLALSPDGKLLAVGDGMGMALYETASGEKAHRCEGHHGPVTALAFSPDGDRLFSGGGDGTVLVWDLPILFAPGRPITDAWDRLAGDAPTAWRAAEFLVQRPEEAVRMLDDRLKLGPKVTDAELARLVGDLDADTFAVRESAQKRLHALGVRAEPILRRTLTRRPSLETHRRIEKLLRALRTPAPGELRKGRAVRVLERIATDEARVILKRLSGGEKTSLLAQDARAGLRRLDARHGAGGRPEKIAFAPAGEAPSLPEKREMIPLAWDRDKVTALAFSPDGEMVASAGEGGLIFLTDRHTACRLATLHTVTPREYGRAPLHSGVLALAFSPDGKVLAAGGRPGRLSLWDPRTGKRLRTLAGHKAAVAGVAFSPDGKWLASASYDGTARLWDLSAGKEVRCLEAHDRVTAVAFSPDGRSLFTGGMKRTRRRLGMPEMVADRVRIWEVATGKERKRLAVAGDGLAVSPDGRWLAAAGREVFIDKNPTGEKRPAGERMFDSSWDPRSDFHILVGDERIHFSTVLQLFDLREGKVVWSRRGGGCAVAFSPDGDTLIVAEGPAGGRLNLPGGISVGRGGDPRTVIRDTRTGKVLSVIPHRWATALAVRGVGKGRRTAGGALLVTGDAGGSVRMWDLTEGQREKARQSGRRGKPEPADLAGWWRDLGGPEPERMVRDAWRTDPVGGPDGFSFPDDRKVLARKYARAHATAAYRASWALTAGGDRAVDFLADRLKAGEPRGSPEEELRPRRAVEVLERIGSARARRALRELAENAPRADVKAAARQALARIKDE